VRRSGAAIALLAAASLLAGCQGNGESESGAIPESSGVPLLQPHSPYAPESDDPPALRAELERREREGIALMRKASRSRADAASGCVRASPTALGAPQPRRWLPRAPKISARLLGRQVEVDVELQGNPTSLACRPMGFTIVVSSGQGGTSGFNSLGGVANYLLFGPGTRTAPRRFRVLGLVPINGSPPYHLSANTESPIGLSPDVEQTLRCPSTGDVVTGCLPGRTVEPHAFTVPSPVLPVHGVTARALERSVAAGFAFDPHPRVDGPVTCSTVTTCSVPFSDALRAAKGTARYRVQGEQVAGCWLGTLTRLEREPEQAEVVMPESIGGCVAWR